MILAVLGWAKLLRSNSLNLSLFQSQIKVWMIECLVYACQAEVSNIASSLAIPSKAID